MSGILGVILLVLVLPRVSAAGEESFGVRGGVSLPNGTLRDPSYYVDAVGTLKSKGNISMAYGAAFANFKSWDVYNDEWEPVRRIAGFVGPQVLVPRLSSAERKISVYVLPAISAGPTYLVSSGSDKTWRWGIDLGSGLMTPIFDGKQKLEIGIVYSLTNALKKKIIEGYYDYDLGERIDDRREPSLNLLSVHLGLRAVD